MLKAVWAGLGRVRLTLLYAAALLAVAEVLVYLGPRTQSEVVRQVSTNLHNLGEGRLGTLIGSAFVNEAGPVYIWLPGVAALLALGELLWRSRRLLVAFVVGHVGATLIVAAGLAAAVAGGLLSASVADSADVGMSYGAVGVLGTVTAAIPGRWRASWMGWWLAVAATSVALSGGDFTNAGHAIALVLGMAVGSRFGVSEGWTPIRWALLVFGGAFGFLMMAYDESTTAITAVVGVAGAAVAGCASLVAERWSAGLVR